jgi:hypothetical protein
MKVIDSLYPTGIALWENVSGSIAMQCFQQVAIRWVMGSWAAQSLRGVRFQKYRTPRRSHRVSRILNW